MISVDNVNCRGRLTYVTLEFPAGAKVGVMGRSGAGKSSLISVLTGQLFPDSGTVTMPSGGIGYIPQDPRHHVASESPRRRQHLRVRPRLRR